MAIINSINTNQAQFSLNRADAAADPVRRPASAGKYIDSSNNHLVPLQKSGEHPIRLSHRQSINSSLNDAAISIRTADSAMKTIGKHISSMKSQLDIIVKHYPPFLTNSPERIKALRNFSAFRKEIEALTFPPEDSGAAKIMADPALFPQAGNQTVAFGKGGSGPIRSQQVHTGSTGLDIPALSDAATDAEIHVAVGSLDAAQNTLGQRRAELNVDAANLLPSGKFTDLSAEHMSVNVGRSIARELSQGMTGMRPLLLHLV